MPSYSLRPPAARNRDPSPPSQQPLQQLEDAQAVTMSAELFEKLFLARHPQSTRPWQEGDMKGDGSDSILNRRRSFGNPTPIALVGIVISLTPLSCNLMGLLGGEANGTAGVATYYFFGGLLLLIASLLEWLMGNSFPSVVFAAYGAFFFSFAGTMTPSFAAFSSYALYGEDPMSGLRSQSFNASFGWILVWMGILSLVFFICSLRTNVAMAVVFASLVGLFATLAAAYFLSAASFDGGMGTAGTVVKAGGVCGFVASMATWWLLLSALLETVDFPIRVPLGDLSGWLHPASSRTRIDV